MMNVPEYEKILQHLDAATLVLLRHQGELRDIDIRIRHLLSITTTETRRALHALEVLGATAPQLATSGAAG